MAGLTVLDHSRAKIEGNQLLDNGTQGIVLTNSQASVTNNTVANNHHHGIGIYADSTVLAAENVVRNNGADEKRGAGIMVVGTDNATVRQNTLENNYGPGVQTRVCSPLIASNYFINDSVLARSRSGPRVRDNIFTSFGKVSRDANSGVNIRSFSFPLISGNTFLGFFGINVRKNSKPVITDNVFSGDHKSSISSGRSGIKVSVESSPVILRNLFYNENKVVVKGRSYRKNLEHDKESKRIRRIRRRRKKGFVIIQDNLFL
jgi:parallel beta-helix repeat protein